MSDLDGEQLQEINPVITKYFSSETEKIAFDGTDEQTQLMMVGFISLVSNFQGGEGQEIDFIPALQRHIAEYFTGIITDRFNPNGIFSFEQADEHVDAMLSRPMPVLRRADDDEEQAAFATVLGNFVNKRLAFQFMHHLEYINSLPDSTRAQRTLSMLRLSRGVLQEEVQIIEQIRTN